jgi:hypothetical protein
MGARQACHMSGLELSAPLEVFLESGTANLPLRVALLVP